MLVFAQPFQQEATDRRIVFDEQQSHAVLPEHLSADTAVLRVLMRFSSSVDTNVHGCGPDPFVMWLTLICAPHRLASPHKGSPRRRASDGPLPVGRTGEDVYREACATCHGVDGRGSPKSIVGFDVPLPDFSDCAFATAEPDQDWQAVVHEGGPIRGLDRHMPAFGDALSQEEIALAVGHVRTFCRQPDVAARRPEPAARVLHREGVSRERVGLGDDVHASRRALGRERADLRTPARGEEPDRSERADQFPAGWRGSLEPRAGRSGLRVQADGLCQHADRRHRRRRHGSDPARPAKSSSGWGTVTPSSNRSRCGARSFRATRSFSCTAAWSFPSDSTKGSREGYLRTALGTTFAQHGGFGRAWSPQVEVLWARPQDRASEWDVVPQVQVTLSKLQHVMVAGGIRIPVSQRSERPRQGLVYLVWDWFDGGFFEFWK